ncbi:MAG: adenylate/guanylate cyclase domain-containing protein [Xanthobacteraceae bacterium]
MSASEPSVVTTRAAQPAAGRPVVNPIFRRLGDSLLPSIVLLLIVLAGLPVAVWLDMRNLSEQTLRAQAAELMTMIDGIRGYYAGNVVARVLANGGATHVVPDYVDVPGGIPIPATLSLELGSVIGKGNVRFRFFSDYPFKNRAPHAFDDFERAALATLRQDPGARVYDVSGSIFDRGVRLAAPIVMEAACVSCHNTHPLSPKRDWKVGDVRGIEEFIIRQPIAAHVFAFKWLIGYFVLVTAIGLAFIGLQRHQSVVIQRFNRELGRANEFLAAVAKNLAKYLSPQHFRSIFSGEKDVVVATERRKLTIFFSDVVGFTTASERLQPEELTALLNEYLTEMSRIAVAHGGTVNKFIGDAILVFFGDPETRGVVEDAKACVLMAFDMQARLVELNAQWRRRGIEEPFRARIGINTGYVNVGNFGSDDRMDYTIIGAEANLAARLQSIAEPGGIVLSYETYSLVRQLVRARPLEPITLKGISRPVVPYAVDGRLDGEAGGNAEVISERGAGLELFLDVRALDASAAERAGRILEDAAAAVRQKQQGGA